MPVYFGGDNEFNTLVFGEQDPRTLEHLHRQVYEAPSVQLLGTAQEFFAHAQQKFEYYNGAEAQRAAQAALRKVREAFQDNIVRLLDSLEALQQATPVMQRYVMAEPSIRQAYQEQRVDGYADTYVDMHPGGLGEHHYDWRRVQQGLVEISTENPDELVHTEWVGDLEDGDRELTVSEQMDVKSTWEFAKAYLILGVDDPVSPVGGKL